MSTVFRIAMLILVTLAVFFFALICTDIKPNNPLGDDFVYPLEIGNSWSYSGILSVFNVRPDSLADEIGLFSTGTSLIEVISDTTLMDSIDVCIMREILTQHRINADTFLTENYFRNLESGLYYYGRRGMNSKVVPLKINPHKYYFEINGKRNDSPQALFEKFSAVAPGICLNGDPLSITLPPRLCLRYPLEKNASWSSYESSEIVTIDKEVIGFEYVDTPAGLFPCCKIQWLFNVGDDGEVDTEYEYFDYISYIGLVKRETIIRDVRIGTYEHPTGIAIADIRNDYILSSYNQK